MKCLRQPLLLAAAGAWLAAAPLPAPEAHSRDTGAKAGSITDRIDALFRRRLRPVPLPVSLPNPFIVVAGGSLQRTDAEPAADTASLLPNGLPKSTGEIQPATDAKILADYVAKLKIGGTIEVNGVTQLIINQSSYKEGDYIFIDDKDAVKYLQISRLTPNELTLSLNEAVQVIRLKYPAKPKNAEP